jgi:hypothetical protein
VSRFHGELKAKEGAALTLGVDDGGNRLQEVRACFEAPREAAGSIDSLERVINEAGQQVLPPRPQIARCQRAGNG